MGQALFNLAQYAREPDVKKKLPINEKKDMLIEI